MLHHSNNKFVKVGNQYILKGVKPVVKFIKICLQMITVMTDFYPCVREKGAASTRKELLYVLIKSAVYPAIHLDYFAILIE